MEELPKKKQALLIELEEEKKSFELFNKLNYPTKIKKKI